MIQIAEWLQLWFHCSSHGRSNRPIQMAELLKLTKEVGVQQSTWEAAFPMVWNCPQPLMLQ